MPTTNWKVADLSKIAKLCSKSHGKKANDRLKALQKSAANGKKALGELDKLAKEEGD